MGGEELGLGVVRLGEERVSCYLIRKAVLVVVVVIVVFYFEILKKD